MDRFDELLFSGQLNILEEEIKKLLEEENDNSRLWYLLFLSQNNNFIDLDFNNINNELAFQKAIELASLKEEMEYKLSYELYKQSHTLPGFDRLFRYYQLRNYNACMNQIIDLCQKEYKDISINKRLLDSLEYLFSSVENLEQIKIKLATLNLIFIISKNDNVNKLLSAFISSDIVKNSICNDFEPLSSADKIIDFINKKPEEKKEIKKEKKEPKKKDEPIKMEVSKGALIITTGKTYDLLIPSNVDSKVEYVFDYIKDNEIETIGIAFGSDVKEIDTWFPDDYCSELKELIFYGNIGCVGDDFSGTIPGDPDIIFMKNIYLFIDDSFNDVSFNSLTVKGNVDDIGSGSFVNIKTKKIAFEGSVNTIESFSFDNIDVDEMIFDGDIEVIESNSFVDSNIKSLTFNGDIETIEDTCFCDTKFNDLYFSGAKTIGNHSFGDITANQIAFDSIIENIGNTSFVGSTINELIFREEIKNIEEYCFNNLTINELIFEGEIENIGDYCFTNSTINKLIFKCKVGSIGYNCFNNSNIDEIIFEGEIDIIGFDCFPECNIGSIRFNDNLGSIGLDCFCDSNIKNIAFNGKIKEIDQGSFKNCSFFELVFNGDVETIESGTFSNCPNLKKVLFKEKIIEIFANSFSNCPNLNTVELPLSIVYIGAYAFDNKYKPMVDKTEEKKGMDAFKIEGDWLIEYLGHEKVVSIPRSVKKICRFAFKSNPFVKQVNIPKNVEIIETQAFFEMGYVELMFEEKKPLFGFPKGYDRNLIMNSDYNIYWNIKFDSNY